MAVGDKGTISIVEEELNKHMNDIIDCSNQVKSILSKIDDKMSFLKTHYVGRSDVFQQIVFVDLIFVVAAITDSIAANSVSD